MAVRTTRISYTLMGLALALALWGLLPTLGVSAASAQDAKPTGELRIAMAGIGFMRPVPWQETVFGKGYMTLLYDFLVGTNPDGSLSRANGVAKDWETSEDGLTWTFKLREGITFHNGTELTAEDVKWSLEMVTSPQSVAAFAARLRNSIASIEAPDAYTVVIRTKKPDLWLAQDLSMASGHEAAILSKKYFEQVGEAGISTKPIGSGPYRWRKGIIGAFIELAALDRHWAEGVPKYKTVTYKVVPEESTRVAMLKTGEVDIIGVSRERVPELQASGFRAFVKERGSVIGCYFH